MRYRYLLLPGLLLTLPTLAQTNRVSVKPPLTHVTVYLNGTMLEHQAPVTLAAGLNRVLVSGLARRADADRLEVQVGDGAEVLAVDDDPDATDDPAADEPATPGPPALRPALADSVRRLEAGQRTAQAELEGLRAEQKFLLANQTVPAGVRGRWSTEVQRGATLMQRRLPAIEQVIARHEARLATLARRLAQLQAGDGPAPADPAPATTQHVLLVQATHAGTGLLTLRYFLNGRQQTWEPELELQANAAGNQVQFITHGRLRNLTGLDWQRVPVTLLRYAAADAVQQPVLVPWELDFEGSHNGGEGRVDAFVVKGSAPGQPAVQQSTRYDLPEPLTLPDRTRYEVRLPPVTLPARTEYLAVPRASEQVVLQTKVAGWQGLQLPEEASIYRNGTFVGSTKLDAAAYNDSLTVVLGTDAQLLVGRAKLEDLSTPVPGTTRRRLKLTYELNVQNRHPEAVRLRLLDEVPISQEKEIEVKILEKSGAEHDERTGKLTWLLALPPGRSQRLTFSFQVEYPSNRKVEIINHRVRISSPKFR